LDAEYDDHDDNGNGNDEGLRIAKIRVVMGQQLRLQEV